MQQETSRRIDFLLRVTGTQNAQLARALNFDASYISRIRSGKRGLPPELPFIKPASEFFARNVRLNYQAEALAHEIGVAGAWPADETAAANLIAQWLSGATATDGTCGAGNADPCASHAHFTVEVGEGSREGASFEARPYFGDDGHRQAVLAFLSSIAAAREPCEILLQSDEATDWMYEDPAFVAEWTRLMTSLANAGCTFTLVHTVSRDANEMWEGVREWIPLYLTGAIRPYYYPRLRDGVRMRSLFIARGACAIVSNSIQGMQGDALSIMVNDKDVVSALAREFDAYLGLCRPLMEMLHPGSTDELSALFDDYRGVEDVMAAEVSDVLVCARIGHGALVVSTGENPAAFRITEPRLADAIANFVDRLPQSVAGPAAFERLLGKLIGP